VTDAPPLTSRRVAALAIAAAALHGAFDAVLYRVPGLVPPYLRLSDAPEAFQMLSPLAVSIAASCVSAVIAVIAVGAIEAPHRSWRTIGLAVTGFWVFSAALMRATWLSTPWSTTALALLAGVPRGFVIGWVLARLVSVRSVSASRDGAA
jgi:hypothetical protein